MDNAARTEQRRRALNGEPPFKPGDVVMVNLWRGGCWAYHPSLSLDSNTRTLEALPPEGPLFVCGGKNHEGKNRLVGIRLDSTYCTFCCHDENWTLVRWGAP